jgi:hypothetical protein
MSKNFSVKLVCYDDSAEVVQPCKEPLNFPSAPIAPQWTSILLLLIEEGGQNNLEIF